MAFKLIGKIYLTIAIVIIPYLVGLCIDVIFFGIIERVEGFEWCLYVLVMWAIGLYAIIISGLLVFVTRIWFKWIIK